MTENKTLQLSLALSLILQPVGYLLFMWPTLAVSVAHKVVALIAPLILMAMLIPSIAQRKKWATWVACAVFALSILIIPIWLQLLSLRGTLQASFFVYSFAVIASAGFGLFFWSEERRKDA